MARAVKRKKVRKASPAKGRAKKATTKAAPSTGPVTLEEARALAQAKQPKSWHNELHPARAGFGKFADIFHVKLKALFPDRVA